MNVVARNKRLLLRGMALLRVMILVVLVSALPFIAGQCRADYVVIVNKENNMSDADEEELGRIFLKKEKSFANGEMIVPVDQRYGRKIREAFYRQIVGKDENELRYYWSKKRFSGDIDPPRTMNNDLEVFYFVAGNKNAIGYVEDTFVNDKVHVVKVFPVLR